MKIRTELIKSFIPPIVLNKIQYFKAYLQFFSSRRFVRENSSLRNLYKGKRCFILGSGKSIDLENLAPLNGEIIIGIHSFVHHPIFNEIMTSDIPKFYFNAPIHAPETEEDWTRNFTELQELIPENVKNIFGLSNYSPSIKDIVDKNNLFNNRKINWFFSNIVNSTNIYSPSKKDLDLQSNIWTSNTGSVLALIAAIYMGFDKIYLLGMDHDLFLHEVGEGRFEDINKDFFLFEKEIDIISMQDDVNNMWEFNNLGEIFLQYQRLNEMYPGRIFNLGKKSLLDIFPQQDLSKVLQEL